MKQKLSATVMKIDFSMPNLAGETFREYHGIFRFQHTKFHSVFSIVFQFYTHFISFVTHFYIDQGVERSSIQQAKRSFGCFHYTIDFYEFID